VLALLKKAASAQDVETRRRLLHAIEHRLTTHARIEEDLFYPAVKELATENAEEMVAKALQEHRVVGLVLAELLGVDPADERFEVDMTVLEGLVEHHTEEEEREMFRLAEKLDEAQLEELGDQMAARAREAER
jgi:hypothetical protein